MARMDAKNRSELEAYIQQLQKKYANAFQRNNLNEMIECCGNLSVAYAAAECNSLAEKWMDEYVKNLEVVDPTIRAKIQTIRTILPNQ